MLRRTKNRCITQPSFLLGRSSLRLPFCQFTHAFPVSQPLRSFGVRPSSCTRGGIFSSTFLGSTRTSKCRASLNVPSNQSIYPKQPPRTYSIWALGRNKGVDLANHHVLAPVNTPRAKWAKIFKRLMLLSGMALAGAYLFFPELRQPALIAHQLKLLFGGCIRGAWTLYTMATIAADYKYTWWKYPADGDPKLHQAKTDEVHQRCAERLLKLCFTNKGLYIKVGQYLASMNHALPRQYIQTLKVLQDQAPFVDYSVVEQIFLEDLGHKPDYYFQEFNKIPLAAGSLAQVHHAITHEGEELAVKVQYPTLRDEYSGDMLTHWLVLKIAAMLFEEFDLVWMHDELEASLTKELDFEIEARNSERCAQNFRDNPHIYVPKVNWNFTTKRILAMEFIKGCKITDTYRLKLMDVKLADAVGVAIEALSEQIYLHGFVHCDPHPGNIFVRKCANKKSQWYWKWMPNKLQRLLGRDSTSSDRSFQVVLLDHGLYREVSNDVRLNYCKLWKALVMRDDERVKEYSKALGIESDWELFALIVLMRPYNKKSIVGLAGDLGHLDLEQMRLRYQSKVKDIFLLMKRMPRELLLVLRNQNYLRALNKECGEPVNRFVLMARTAVKGIACKDCADMAHHQTIVSPKIENIEHLMVQPAASATRLEEKVRAWKNVVQFEVYLQFYECLYWLMKVWMLCFGPSISASALGEGLIDRKSVV